MKKILLATTLCLTIAGSAFATASTEEKKVTFDYKYPVISGLANKDSEANINSIIAKKLLSLRKAHAESEYIVSGGMNYKMGTETDKYISFTLQSYDYHGGAHGMYYTEGFVFDKESGKRLAYTDFVPQLTASELVRGLRAGAIKGYTADGNVSGVPFMDNKTRLSKNFVLNKDGSISLIYGPYELDAYAAGNIYVKLTPELVQNIKRLR